MKPIMATRLYRSPLVLTPVYKNPASPDQLQPCKPRIHNVFDLGDVLTSDGTMRKVKLNRRNMELANPDKDIAAVVGIVGLRQQELWYWNDCYWMKASSGGSEWYREQCFLLYQVDLVVPAYTWAKLDTGPESQ